MDVSTEELLAEVAAGTGRKVLGRLGRGVRCPDKDELLAALKQRREDLKRLIQLVTERAGQETYRPPASRHRCRNLAAHGK